MTCSPAFAASSGAVGVEDRLAHRRARRGVDPARQLASGLFGAGDVFVVEARQEQLHDLLGSTRAQRLFLGDHLLADHLDGGPDGGGGGALGRARLEHVEPALLDGELEVLHVAVVALQPRRDLLELVVDAGHLVLEGG